MTTAWRFPHILGRLLFLAAVLTACAGQPEHFWIKAPGWSRAQLVGNTRVGDPVPITYDDQGQLYIFLISARDEVSHLRVISFDRHGEVVWDRTYEEITLTGSKKPQILWDGELLQLFWINRNGLYSAMLDTSGNLLGPPNLLSGETIVDHFDVTSNSSGSIAVWYAGSQEDPGIYALPPGNLTDAATLIDPEGIMPDLQYDKAGTLHAIWARYPPGGGEKPFLYAAYPDSAYPAELESIVAAPRVIGTSVLEGPHLGLDNEHVYIFWSKILFSGLEAGTATTYYVYFQKGQHVTVSADQQLLVPYSYDLTYQTFPTSDLKAGERVSLDSESFGGSNYVTKVKANPTDEEELVIVLNTRRGYLMRKTKPQVSAVFLQDGNPIAYQQLSFTPSSSASPAIFSNEEGQLYLTWLEKGELPGWAIYFASTDPEVGAALNDLTLDDLGRLTAETLFGLLSGAVLIPVFLAWALPAFIVLVLTSRIRGGAERLTSPGVMISIILTFLIYYISKVGILPGMLNYLPFSAWIPVIPSWLKTPLQLGVPLVSAGLALLAAWNFTYRKRERSIFFFMAIFAIVDGFITMTVYGVLVYAAF